MLAALQPRWQRWLARRIPAASSVTLNQRRIFIVPSATGGAFALVLLLMLLAAINYQNSLAYGLTFLLMSLFIIAILHTYRNLAGLTLRAVGANPVFVGEQGSRLGLVAESEHMVGHRVAAYGHIPVAGFVRFGEYKGQKKRV